jgi:[protein-PII] uridylyltransferase
VERLKLLTLLTYADISSAQPSDTTPWREELLLSLYSQTYAALTRELGLRITQHDAAVNPDLQQFLEGMPARYLRTHSEHEIHEHLQLEREGGWKGVGVSLDRSTAWSLTVVASDRPSLFASIAAALSSYGFNILKAEAFSNKRGTAIETFRFADPAHLLELNSAQAQEFTKTVIQAVKGEISVADLLKRRPKVKPDAKALAASRVNFDNQASPSATLIELVAHDRPGLLCDVASAIAKRGGNIEVLLVDTAANRAMDVLYVTKRGAKLNDQEAGEMAKAIAAINAV